MGVSSTKEKESDISSVNFGINSVLSRRKLILKAGTVHYKLNNIYMTFRMALEQPFELNVKNQPVLLGNLLPSQHQSFFASREASSKQVQRYSSRTKRR
ncbi:hypothetical protein P7H17_26330 [Paenibacillus larvae]|nr:hypothetical protein [Paenibacillus larvae]MDT2288863.1 hypothetical protein [Paenibacillus larvae]